MAATEADINALLDTLEALLKQIEPLRRSVHETEKGLEQTQREYDQKLGQANAEADRLEAEKNALKARLNRQNVAPPAPRPPLPEPVAPPAVADIRIEPQLPIPPPPQESLRRKSKRALLDYIFSFTDTGPVIEQIHALVDDDGRDMGEMLELLAWGEIWKTRTRWESIEQQWQRLDEWRVALEQRLAYWTQERRHLADDTRYSLWQRRSELVESEWRALLDDLLSRQETDNKRAATEVAALNEQWQLQSKV